MFVQISLEFVHTYVCACTLFPTSGQPSVNRKDLTALTLAGHTSQHPVLDTLVVLHLDNRLYKLLFFLD